MLQCSPTATVRNMEQISLTSSLGTIDCIRPKQLNLNDETIYPKKS